MTPITKILVPVDLSARSLVAATYAASLAAEFGSELVFLHVLQNGWPLAEDEGEIRDRVHATPGAHRFLFREGSPAPVILETAEAERADLILIPTRGKPALSRFIDGSIAARVLRGAHWSADLAKHLDASLSVIHESKALESNPGRPGDEESRFWLKKMARDEIRTLQD